MITLTQCPLCGAGRFSPFLTGKDRLSSDRSRLTVVRCDACTFCFTNPRPADEILQSLYPSSYIPWQKGKGILRGLYPFYFRLTRSLFLKPGGRVLDIGCGSGLYLAYLARKGMEPFGCDFGPPPEVAGIRFFQGTLEKASYPSDFFDGIVAWHFLEHVPDPRKTLREMCRVLKRDGQMLVSVPNIKGMEIRIFKGASHLLDVPRHLSHFSAETLERLLFETGFHIIQKRNDWLMPGPWIRSLFYVLEDTLRVRGSDAFLEKMAVLGIPFSFVLNGLSSLCGTGNLLVFQVRKQTP